jgi:hypothetical protein
MVQALEPAWVHELSSVSEVVLLEPVWVHVAVTVPEPEPKLRA